MNIRVTSIKSVVISLTLLSSATLYTTHAQQMYPHGHGMYLETSLGISQAKTNQTSGSSNASFSVGVGYDFNPYLSTELKYQTLYKDNQYKSDALSLRGVFNVPLEKELRDFNLNMKIGLGSTRFKNEIGSATGLLNYGVGIKYNIKYNWAVGLDVDFYATGDTTIFHNVKQTNISLVNKYKF